MSLPRLCFAVFLLCLPAFSQYNSEPTGGIRILWRLEKLTLDIERARDAADPGVREEHYTGYPLSTDKDLRRKQMMLRYAALEEEEHLLRVVAKARDPKHRAIAATALGYSRQSQKQLDALSRAANDSDASVRRNAVRALQSLARAKPKLRDRISVPLE
ncbi:MAG TPA: HEAT repeat domain-containing protein [Bryobacteraceae bacterium]|nr:HEAT repeat domain-containing protein [Bryobacteraceae bacterium]